MIAELTVVAGKTQHIADAVGVSAQDIRLHGQAVAVAADHLKVGFNSFLDQNDAGGPAGHSHHGGLIVGDIDRIYIAFEKRRLFSDFFAVGAGISVYEGVHQLLRAIRTTSGDSATRPQDYIRKLARVTIAIKQPAKGEVAIQVRGAERYVPAVAVGPVKDIAVGSEVVVVAYRGGIAQVVSCAEFERRARST